MNKTGKHIKYSDGDGPFRYECSICGKQGSICFKNAVVCEDCLQYIKHMVG